MTHVFTTRMGSRFRLRPTGDCSCRFGIPSLASWPPIRISRGMHPYQTIVQSAQLDPRPGLDDALCADGICGVAHLAAAGGFCSASFSADLLFIQLAPAWSWMFLGAHNPLLGVINIVQHWSFSPLSSRFMDLTGWLPGASCRSRRGLALRSFSKLRYGG
jgi:hypothetical protein